MPRYYFHVRNGGFPLDDETGEVHRTIEAAEARARLLARELSHEPETYHGYSVVVIDEDGKTIARVQITQTDGRISD
jgi:hypothetical protein